MCKATHEPITPELGRQKTDHPATLEDFDAALTEAQIITDIVAMLAASQIGEVAQPCGSLFDWLASELDARLERIQVARMTLAGRVCA